MIECKLNDSRALIPKKLMEGFIDSPRFIDMAGRKKLASYCNRFIDITGPLPSYGYFAMVRSDAKKLRDAGSITLFISSGNNYSLTVKGLMFVKATSLRPVIGNTSNNDNDPFVVEVADNRYMGNHPWINLDSSSPKIFNIIDPLLGPGNYYADSLNSGSPWTWQGMLGALWPSWLSSTAPTIPATSVPAITPTNFDFRQYTTYQALLIFLSRIGLLLSIDRQGGYQLSEHSTKDTLSAGNDQLESNNASALEEEIEWLEPESTYFPAGIRVHFQKSATQPGSENVYNNGSTQWFTNLDYVVTVADPKGHKSIAGTYACTWDDLPAFVDPFTGSITNSSDLAARAQERANNYFNSLLFDYRKHKSYTGVLPFIPCGILQGVNFFQSHDRSGAWVTEIFAHPFMTIKLQDGDMIAENTLEPASPWQWKAVPAYPYQMATVLVNSGPDANGDYSISIVGNKTDHTHVTQLASALGGPAN